MASGKFISYLRVSTERQGRSGLGLSAQRDAVERHLNGGDWSLVREYVETESGRRSDRPQLRAALAHARNVGATLIIAKLDRLARNTRFLLTILDSGADVVFCDLPQVPAGPTGRFILTNMAAVAELEAGLISQRTKEALARKREQLAVEGRRLGNPNGAAHLKPHGNAAAVCALKERAHERALNLKAVVDDIRAAGVVSGRGMAKALNERGILTPRGGSWHPASAARLLARLDRA